MAPGCSRGTLGSFNARVKLSPFTSVKHVVDCVLVGKRRDPEEGVRKEREEKETKREKKLQFVILGKATVNCLETPYK